MAVVCYVSLLLIYFICSNLYLLIPHSNCPSPLPLLFGNHKFVFYICKYVSVLCIYSFVSWTLLNRSGENRHPCFLPDLKKKAFRFSPLIIVLTLLGWRSSLLFLVSFLFLSWASVRRLSQASSVSNEIIFPPVLLRWRITLTGFCMLNQPAVLE